MKNVVPRRLSEERRKDSKLKLTWTKARTDLRNSWEDFWNFFESMMDDLMFGVSLSIWMLWRFWTVMEKRENNTLTSLYVRDWKRGGFYPTQILKGNTVRWIKIPPLDARDITLPKYLMTFREFRSVRSNDAMTKWLKWRPSVRKFECL